MNLSREHFRAMIFYDFKKSLTPLQCFESLNSVFGDEAPSQRTVYEWYANFKRGRVELCDESREGRPATAVTPENIDAVRNLLQEDHRTTYREIKAHLGIGMTQIKTILHDHLGVRKLCARWIPHNLTEAQKKARVKWSKEMLKKYDHGRFKAVYDIVTGDESWIYCYEPESKRQSSEWVFPDEPNPTKVKRSRSAGKKMIASFFKKIGPVVSVALENRRTVNAEWYTTICLPTVFEKVRQNRPRSRIVLHQDNASSHNAEETKKFLATNRIDLMTHPPYSPDLAPCDFFLFPYIKDKMRGVKFNTADAAVEAFENLVSEVPPERWAKCFDDWFYRMKKCIQCNGEYFKKH
jgi:[histone H3]-lysine36 N-dimethyltransferase SETMAR